MRRYRVVVGTNLRLSDELATALRNAAALRGQSQQEIVREAIAKELGLTAAPTAVERAIQAGLIKAADALPGGRHAGPAPG